MTLTATIDALVIGAGPVGLFQVFELGLLGIRAHVIDSLSEPGGQCIELYPDKPIYDIPATPVCTGRELISRLMAQIAPFEPQFHLGQQVDVVQRQDDGRWRIETSSGTKLLAKTVFIAGGVGSFQPRRLKVDGIGAFEGKQLFYSVPANAVVDARRVIVIGDGDSALTCAADFAERHIDVTLMHRRDEFKAEPATVERVQRMRSAGHLKFIAAQPTAVIQENARLTALQVLSADGTMLALPVDLLVALTGLSPKLGPISEWGLALERKQVVVETQSFQTSQPGIFAVGDVNIYPGKKKLILCGFHEATLAAYGAAALVFPGQPLHLEYTTTSPRLHRALGVRSESSREA